MGTFEEIRDRPRGDFAARWRVEMLRKLGGNPENEIPTETPEQRLARLSADCSSTPCAPLTKAGEP